MSFTNLDKAAGLKKLNTHLATRSYITGYALSGDDVAVFNQLPAVIDESKYQHVFRWHKHVASFSAAERPAASAAAAGKAAPAADSDSDSDSDSDDDMTLDDLDNDDGDDVAAILKKKKEEAAEKKKNEKKAKSSIILDIKPESGDTDMEDLEVQVRMIASEGLLWGGAELVPVAFGIMKLRIIAIVEDEVVSVDDLQEEIENLEACQSTEIFAFNKV